jgi:hypothetical protein
MALFSGNNGGTMIDHGGPANYQTAEGFFQSKSGTQTVLAVSGTVPLNDLTAYTLIFDGTSGGYFRATDLQGVLDSSTATSVGQVTPLVDGNQLGIKSRQDTGTAVYADTVAMWLVASGSMSPTAVNGIINYWKNRLAPASITAAALGSGTFTTVAPSANGAAFVLISSTTILSSTNANQVLLTGSASTNETIYLDCMITPISDGAGSIGPVFSGTGVVAGAYSAGFDEAEFWNDLEGNANENGSGVAYSWPLAPFDVKNGTVWTLSVPVTGGTAAWAAKAHAYYGP